MRYLLQRHPFPVAAHFRYSLVVTLAFPAPVLKPLLPPGLRLDELRGWGFLAIAMVRTENLRPKSFPAWLGGSFFLTGYRVFTRFRTAAGRELRGLRILRSDADHRTLVLFGNLLTHYNYHSSNVEERQEGQVLNLKISTRNREADLELVANLGDPSQQLPPGSPFVDSREARRFAGPLPFTFDYEPETHSVIVIEGARRRWKPKPVGVELRRATFLDHPALGATRPVLANAFLVRDVQYLWKKGERHVLDRTTNSDPVAVELAPQEVR